MDFNVTNILFLFGMLQCVVMMVLIIKNRDWRTVENLILLSLLLVLFASLIPPFFGNSKLVLRYDFLRFLPLHLVLFVFPLLYLYVKSIFSGKVGRSQLISHLTVPTVFWAYFFIVWLGTLAIETDSKGIWARDFGYFLVQQVHYTMLLLFGIFYTIACFNIISKAQQSGLYKEQVKFTGWIKALIVSLSIGVFLEMIAILLGKYYGYWRSNPIDELLGFSFTLMVKVYNAIVLYAISLVAYSSYTSFKRRNKSICENESEILDHIKSQMEKERMYLDTELTLSKFSSHLGITTARLSNILNNGMGITFNDFVNGYRVQEVMTNVEAGNNGHLTLEAIAENSGFKSKTTFYRAFKKTTDKTPRAYFNGQLGQK
ncbi:MAG: helix-turn-helix domain-containing protein [Saonia sp.]